MPSPRIHRDNSLEMVLYRPSSRDPGVSFPGKPISVGFIFFALNGVLKFLALAIEPLPNM